jgi:penicillin-binding protein 1C
MALDDGLIHSESLLSDAPQNFGGYAPGNFQATFSGPVSVTEALQRSLNVPAVDILERTQPIRFASRLRAGGLRLRMDEGATPNLSLILGGGGTTLEELVGAYRAFAMNGMAGKPRLSKDAPIVQNRMMSEGAAWIIRDILEGGSHPDKPAGDITSRPPFAWKTGTSFGFRDAWAVGVTDRYTIGIWLGRPDGTPNPGYFGANSAAPLARDIAAILPRSQKIRASRPTSVAPQAICWPLGLSRDQTPQSLCHQTRQAWTLNETAPPTMVERANTQGLREVVWQDTASGLRLTSACMQGSTGVQEVEIARWPNLLQPWLQEPVRSQSQPPAYKAGCAPKQSAKAGLVMHGVEPGSVIRAAPKRMVAGIVVKPVVRVNLGSATKRAETSQMAVDTILNLTVSGASGSVLWLLSGKVLTTTQANEVMKLPINQDGTYRLTATDAAGKFTFVEFSARGFVG